MSPGVSSTVQMPNARKYGQERFVKVRSDCRLLRFVFAFLVLSAPVTGFAQDMVYQIQAQLIDRFTQLIEWPSSSNTADTSTPFVIGVIGNSDILQSLESLATQKKIKGKKIEVIEISNLPDIDGCQVLYISKSEKSRLSAILNQTKGKPVLTIGDTRGYAKDGVMINFSTGETMRFKINEASADASGLRFSEQLLSLGEKV
jgi:hypothetical protein